MMQTSFALHTALMAGAALTAAAPQTAAAEPFRFHLDHVLGTSLDLAVAGSRAEAEMAASAALREIERLDALLSGWRSDSELSALNRSAGGRVSPELYAVLERCEHWRAASGGAYDCRLGEVEALWRTGAAAGAPPAPDALGAALARAAQPLRLDPASRTVTRPAGVRLAIDGLAKGWIVDAAGAAALRAAPGLNGLMVDIGGDLRCWGRPAPDRTWRIGVSAPGDGQDGPPEASLLSLAEMAVATSGRGPRDLCVGGARYAHLYSSRTGAPASKVAAATVIAARAADADAAATALAALPVRQALALAERTPGIEALLIAGGGDRLHTSGWTRFEVRGAAPASCAAPAGPAWPAGFAVTVDYEVPKLATPRYHAPYVVMWITDPDGQMVRTLLMLGRKNDWVPENYIWWRRYGRRTPDIVDSVARATRAPGRYNVVWDGLDDNGRRAGQGRYVLHIEAARERGGHTYQSIGLDLGAAPSQSAAPAKDELGALQARYGERS
jgi:thiamine biosynthesis lipoprotein